MNGVDADAEFTVWALTRPSGKGAEKPGSSALDETRLEDGVRALEIVRAYLDQVAEPLDALNEMLVDDDLLPVREGLRGLREELKREGGGGLFAPLGKLNDSMRSLAESVGVEWK